MTGTQIFATHYLDAFLGVTALVRDRRTPRGYFVYLNRSDVDLLGGFWVALRAGLSLDEWRTMVRRFSARLQDAWRVEILCRRSAWQQVLDVEGILAERRGQVDLS